MKTNQLIKTLERQDKSLNVYNSYLSEDETIKADIANFQSFAGVYRSDGDVALDRHNQRPMNLYVFLKLVNGMTKLYRDVEVEETETNFGVEERSYTQFIVREDLNAIILL